MNKEDTHTSEWCDEVPLNNLTTASIFFKFRSLKMDTRCPSISDKSKDNDNIFVVILTSNSKKTTGKMINTETVRTVKQAKLLIAPD